ncbi:MGMT family protein [Brachybacterium fresconis]|uniref:Alkylated DNA nucleotide flippase Atl1 n=1 Tax=Brachybacterium fresconis TaxID=173363 RepID=A0ABS4YJH0_9MICO|nr:alkylated DNA nucleotide flippase Atl1 [Brachybacterium fresconis]
MPTNRPRTRMDDLTVERVLRVVEAIPPGRVAAYGEVGAVVGVGPRLVGRILRTWGSGVPWWRVTNASGDHPLLGRALPHWEAEGIIVKRNGLGCRMAEFGADLEQLRKESAPSLADLERLDAGDSADDRAHSTGTSSRK